MRAQLLRQGHGITHKGMVSWTRAQWARRHGRGCGEGGVSSTDEDMAREMLAPWMRRVARMAGCTVMHVLQPAGADVPGGRDRDDGGGGAGGVAVPHLRCATDGCMGKIPPRKYKPRHFYSELGVGHNGLIQP